MPVHEYTHNNFSKFVEYSQGPWYRVSETPPDFEFCLNFTWENLISVKNYLRFLQSCQVKIFFLRKSKFPK